MENQFELEMSSGRARDEFNIVELLRTNPGHVEAIRKHLFRVRTNSVLTFDRILERARELIDH